MRELTREEKNANAEVERLRETRGAIALRITRQYIRTGEVGTDLVAEFGILDTLMGYAEQRAALATARAEGRFE